jgi:hypothetical protein
MARVVALRGSGGGCGGGCGGGGVLSPHPGGLLRSEKGAGFHHSSLLEINKLFYNGTRIFIIARGSRMCTRKIYNKNYQGQGLFCPSYFFAQNVRNKFFLSPGAHIGPAQV